MTGRSHWVFLTFTLAVVLPGMAAPATATSVTVGISGTGAVQFTDASALTCDAAAEGSIRYVDASNRVEFCDDTVWTVLGPGGGGSTTLDSILAATANQAGIANAGYSIVWNWDSLAGATALRLASSSTAAAGNAQTLLNIALSGANGTATQTTYGAQIANTHTGATSTNVGLTVSASGGTNNYSLLVPSGYVGIGTSAPAAALNIDALGSGTGNLLSLTSSGASRALFTTSSGYGDFTLYDGTQTSMVYLSSSGDSYLRGGNLGIGSASPESLLEVQGVEATDAVIDLDADDGDNPADTWFLRSVATGNSFTVSNDSTKYFDLNATTKLVITPPATETIAGAAVITANACGTIKPIQSTGSVTTSTANTFTATTAAGCCMDVINVDAADTITLDANGAFKTIGGADQALGPDDSVTVCSNGTNWYQMGAVSGNQ